MTPSRPGPLCLSAAAALLAAAFAGAARAQDAFTSIRGTVVDGAQDLAPGRFDAVARLFAQAAQAEKRGDPAAALGHFAAAQSNLLQIIQPNGPVTNALVSLSALEGRSRLPADLTAATDSQGSFTFRGVPRGVYRLDVRRAGDARPPAAWTVEHYHNNDHVRLVLPERTVTLQGCVTDAEGRPVAGAAVSARQGRDDLAPEEAATVCGHEADARSGADGRYALAGLLPANVWFAQGLESGGTGGNDVWYTVTASAPGCASLRAVVPVVPEDVRRAARAALDAFDAQRSPYERAARRGAAPAPQPACRGDTLSGVDFALPRAATLSGVCVDAAGRPRPGCLVLPAPTNRAERAGLTPQPVVPAYAEADAQGRFVLTNLPPGAYALSLHQSNRTVRAAAAPVALRAGEARDLGPLASAETALGRIEGTVADAASGQPVQDFTLSSWVRRADGDGGRAHGEWLSPCLCGRLAHHTDDCARWLGELRRTHDLRAAAFVVRDLSPGDAELTVRAPGYAEEKVSVTVRAGACAPAPVRLQRAGTLRIRALRGAAPAVVHDFYQACDRATGARSYGGRKPAANEPDSTDFEGLRPGRYTVRGASAAANGVTRYAVADAAVHAGRVRPVLLQFGGPCAVRVRVDFPPGTAAAVRVETVSSEPDRPLEGNLGLRAYAYLREPGEQLLPDLEPGAYRLSVYACSAAGGRRDRDGRPADATEAVTLSAGEPAPAFAFRLAAP